MTVLSVSFVTETASTLIRSTRWNTNFTDIRDFVNNNNIDGTDNIKALGVTTASIANLAVTDDKIAGITTAGKVSGSALTALTGTPSGAGILPGANGGVPTGAIIMWSGTIATIPSGYVFCNGSNGTPDLRDLMIVGARQDDAGAAKTNVTGALTTTGGAATHTLSTAEIPSHSHSILGNVGVGSSNFPSFAAPDQGATRTTEATGGGGAHNNMPPYYALAFIMKT